MVAAELGLLQCKPLHMSDDMLCVESFLIHIVVKGAEVNDGDNSGSTPLMKASSFNHIDVVGILLEAGEHNKGTLSGVGADCRELPS